MLQKNMVLIGKKTSGMMLKKDTKVKNLLIISFLLLLGSYGFGQNIH